MNYHSSQDQEGASSAQSCLDGDPLDTLNGTNRVSDCCDNGLTTESLTKRRFSAMSEHSSVKGTPQAIREWLMLLPQDSPVNRSVSPAKDKVRTTPEICGLRPLSAFALYDHDTRCWRTSQACLLTSTYDEYSESWPKAGTMLAGHVWTHELRVRRLKGSGFLLPAPTKCMGKRGWGLSRTGRLRYSKELVDNALSFGYKPHPQILEWAMGWPITWTELKPLETDKFRKWYEQHGRL
jgi:hypothetical protein